MLETASGVPRGKERDFKSCALNITIELCCGCCGNRSLSPMTHLAAGEDAQTDGALVVEETPDKIFVM